MMLSRFSGTELLLCSQHWPVHDLWKSRITVKVAAGFLILVVISAVLVAPTPLPERQMNLGLQHPAMAGLVLAYLSFDNINASESAAGSGFPAVASGAVRRREALLVFVLRERNKTAIGWPGDDYDELENT
ncbi:hypothetical protein MRX96_006018 [Rhipicephalus microplus]